MRAIVFNGAGGNEVVEVVTRPDPQPDGAEVLVAVSHAGINPADLQQRRGKYPPPPGAPSDIPGLEVAGTVVAVGPRVMQWQVGDRVFGLVGGGGLADRVLVHERCVAPIPDRLDDATAAAVPEAFMTAHDAIRTQASLTPGETLLVHGANGGVGSAAVAIGALTGAQVIATARSIPAGTNLGDPNRVTWISDDGFAATVADLTGGRGVDVIIELVGAVHFPGNLEVLAQRGRIVIVGVGAGAQSEISLGQLMRKRASLHGTVLRARSLEDKALVVRAFERELLPAFNRGEMTGIVDRVFDVEEVTNAFDYLEQPGKYGKVLLRFN